MLAACAAEVAGKLPAAAGEDLLAEKERVVRRDEGEHARGAVLAEDDFAESRLALVVHERGRARSAGWALLGLARLRPHVLTRVRGKIGVFFESFFLNIFLVLVLVLAGHASLLSGDACGRGASSDRASHDLIEYEDLRSSLQVYGRAPRSPPAGPCQKPMKTPILVKIGKIGDVDPPYESSEADRFGLPLTSAFQGPRDALDVAEIPSYFTDFLAGIRPTQTQKQDAKDGHQRLQQRLWDDPDLSPRVISTFLQGSYRRATALKPTGSGLLDVDVVVVTNLSEVQYRPKNVMELFEPFLNRHYAGKWTKQGRSFGIKMSNVALDLVVTSAPDQAQVNALKKAAVWGTLEDGGEPLTKSLASASIRDRTLFANADGEAWKLKPLRIPDHDADRWEDTHPLAQIAWTQQKNAATNGHYVNVVKAFKWWRRNNPSGHKHPKSYPLEHVVGDSCPDGVGSMAQASVEAFERLELTLRNSAAYGIKPTFSDRGTAENVWKRVEAEDAKAFYATVKAGAVLARKAYDEADTHKSARLWHQLFGDPFPLPPDGMNASAAGALVPPAAGYSPSGRRFARGS